MFCCINNFQKVIMLNSIHSPRGKSFVSSSSDHVSGQESRILWEKAQQYSNCYCEKLNLTRADFEVVRRNTPPRQTGELEAHYMLKGRGFLFVTIRNKHFRLIVCNTNGHYYGGDWKDLIQVLCTNDSTINQIAGIGNTFINVITEQWHQLLLDELQGDLIIDLKKRISAVTSRNLRLWKQVKQHSNEICSRLEIGNRDLPNIKSSLVSNKLSIAPSSSDYEEEGFQFTLDNKKFKLDVYKTSGHSYGGDWENLVQVFCTNDASLNESTGGGPTLVNVIAEQWHRLFLDGPQNAILMDLKKQISDGTSRNMRLWNTLQEHSAEICKRLSITCPDSQDIESGLAKRLGVMPSRLPFQNKDFHVTIEDKIFSVFVDRTCGLNYGGNWKILIQVICINDASLNESTGGGTSLVSVIAEQWHRSLLNKLEALVIDP